MMDSRSSAVDKDSIEEHTESVEEKMETKHVSNAKDPPNINDEFRSPLMPAPLIPKLPVPNKKKQVLVAMTLKKSAAGVPADIYKGPRIAQFMEEEDKKIKPDLKQIKFEAKAEKAAPAVLSYEKPSWSKSLPENKYTLEVLKNGSIVGKVKLAEKEFFTIGRLKDCDIPMEHPLISRYHAILQYGSPDESCEDVHLQKDGTDGLYIIDLRSTHGSFLNKTRIVSSTYFRLKVGHILKFGGSTRMYILQGPSDDQEEVAKESVSELKKMYKQRKEDLAKKMLGEDEDIDEPKTQTISVENVQSVTWGMTADAIVNNDSDDDDKNEKPSPLAPTDGKDRFYVKDPVKALKHFYEQEKLDIVFEYTERRPGHWHARLEMPYDGLDGRTVYAEATATGRKKDAANSCALEACKLLDSEGFFTQSLHHERKVKRWQEDDFYDSDEDEFLDRTGEISRKRSQRMKRVGQSKTDEAETYDSLTQKVKVLEREINDVNKQLQKDKKLLKVDAGASDPLEEFMKQIKSGNALDTITRSKLKLRLVEARKELAQAVRLADLARPASMPKLQTSGVKTFSFIGKMKGKRALGIQKPKSMSTKLNVLEMKENNEVEMEEEENLQNNSEIPTSSVKKNVEIKKTLPEPEIKAESPNTKENTEVHNPVVNKVEEPTAVNENKTNTSVPSKLNVFSDNDKHDISALKTTKRVMGPTLPAELRQKLLDGDNDHENEHYQVEDEPVSKRRKERGKKQKANPHKITNNDYQGGENYVTWVPPVNQSGDGNTSLNDKFGY